jgi:hypothetical protein
MFSGGKEPIIDATTRNHLRQLSLDESPRANAASLDKRGNKAFDTWASSYVRALHTNGETEYSMLSNVGNSAGHGIMSGLHTVKTMGVTFAQGIGHLASNTWNRAVEGNDAVPIVGFALGGVAGLGEGMAEGAIGLVRHGGSVLENMWYVTTHAATLQPEQIGHGYGQGIMTVEGALGMAAGVRAGVGIVKNVTKAPQGGGGVAIGPNGLALAGATVDGIGVAVTSADTAALAGVSFMSGDVSAEGTSPHGDDPIYAELEKAVSEHPGNTSLTQLETAVKNWLQDKSNPQNLGQVFAAVESLLFTSPASFINKLPTHLKGWLMDIERKVTLREMFRESGVVTYGTDRVSPGTNANGGYLPPSSSGKGRR